MNNQQHIPMSSDAPPPGVAPLTIPPNTPNSVEILSADIPQTPLPGQHPRLHIDVVHDISFEDYQLVWRLLLLCEAARANFMGYMASATSAQEQNVWGVNAPNSITLNHYLSAMDSHAQMLIRSGPVIQDVGNRLLQTLLHERATNDPEPESVLPYQSLVHGAQQIIAGIGVVPDGPNIPTLNAAATVAMAAQLVKQFVQDQTGRTASWHGCWQLFGVKSHSPPNAEGRA